MKSSENDSQTRKYRLNRVSQFFQKFVAGWRVVIELKIPDVLPLKFLPGIDGGPKSANEVSQ
jgi:hypothetical protein